MYSLLPEDTTNSGRFIVDTLCQRYSTVQSITFCIQLFQKWKCGRTELPIKHECSLREGKIREGTVPRSLSLPLTAQLAVRCYSKLKRSEYLRVAAAHVHSTTHALEPTIPPTSSHRQLSLMKRQNY